MLNSIQHLAPLGFGAQYCARVGSKIGHFKLQNCNYSALDSAKKTMLNRYFTVPRGLYPNSCAWRHSTRK